MKKSLWLALTLFPGLVIYAQTISTVPGATHWNDPKSWEGGVIPSRQNSTLVIINHPIKLQVTNHAIILSILIQDDLVIEDKAMLEVSAQFEVRDSGRLNCYGTVVGRDGVLFKTLPENTKFYDGSYYQHLQANEGDIPLAEWHPASTFKILGFTGNVTLLSDKWSQDFGNVTYNCPSQGDFVDFRAKLVHVQNDFIIRSTNNNILRLTRSQILNLRIGGNFIIEGLSEVWMGETSRNVQLTVGGDFNFLAISSASSYLTVQGNTTLVVTGNVLVSASTGSKIKFTSTTGGQGTLRIGGDFKFNGSTIDSRGSGVGNIVFEAGSAHQFAMSGAAVFEDNIFITVESRATLDIGSTVINYRTKTGRITMKGNLILQGVSSPLITCLGSLDLNFEKGSSITYKSQLTQKIAGHNGWPDVDVIINSPSVLMENLNVGGNLFVNGALDANNNHISLSGNFKVEGVSLENIDLILNGDQHQTLDLNNSKLRKLTVDKRDGSNVSLESQLNLTGPMLIKSQSNFDSNGNLWLRSDKASTASIDRLPNESRVLGDVHVERYIPSIGAKRFRYLSSPVATATVASMQDDFPVTGKFIDPSFPKIEASLFEYNEIEGIWKAYPTLGKAADNVLRPGSGYSAYMFNADNINWDVTGVINQGPVDFEVTYTPSAGAFKGWNLIGNPYPCAISWNNKEGWSSKSIAPGIAVRNNAEGNFLYWDGDIGELTNGTIAAGQAVWVQTIGPEPHLQINESAKQSGDASFYRAEPVKTDYLQFSVTSEKSSDNAYVRLREGARLEQDSLDINKFSNENIAVAFRLPDNNTVAIFATDKLPCSYSIPIDLKINADKATSFQFDANTFELFKSSKIILRDNKTNMEQDISISSYFFDVTTNEDLSQRFTLTIEENEKFEESKTLIIAENICSDKDHAIVVKNLDPGFEYLLLSNLQAIDSTSAETSDYVFNISNSKIPEGYSNLSLLRRSFCDTKEVASSKLHKSILPTPLVQAEVVCEKGRSQLRATAADSLTIQWFNAAEANEPFGTGAVIYTPWLTKPATYYMNLVDSAGCNGERYPVNVIVYPYDSVQLSYDGERITANYPSVSRWLLNGTVLQNEINGNITPYLPGIYTAQIDIGPCMATGSLLYYPEMEKSLILLTPNPTEGFTSIADDVQLIDVLSTTGQSVLYLCLRECPDSQPCSLDLRNLPSGVYYAVVKVGENFRTVLIAKI